MKKIFTLLFALGTLTSVIAQERRPNNNNNGREDYAYYTANNRNDNFKKDDDKKRNNNYRYAESYSLSTRDRDFKIAMINREYEQKINITRNDRFLKFNEKNRKIKQLEQAKNLEIKKVSVRYDDNRNKYNDRYYDKNFNWRS